MSTTKVKTCKFFRYLMWSAQCISSLMFYVLLLLFTQNVKGGITGTA